MHDLKWWILLIGVSAGVVAGDEMRTIRAADSLPESTPWDLAALSKAPQHSWSEGDAVRSLYYSGEPYQSNPTRVFAYYASPDTVVGKASNGKCFPAVVLVHGGGGKAFPQWAKLWAERGYAAIAMDLAGNGPDNKHMADGGPGQGHDMKFETIGLPVTEQWTYHAVANVIRAHSLIQSFPEVDSRRTAITGISWGGYLTCIVAGLDNRFQAAVPVYGCGFLFENSCWLGDFAKMSSENQDKWVRLWDPSRYVGSAKMPMLFVNGGKDFAYPPDSHAKTYALVQSPKYLHFVPDLPHGHFFDRPKAIERFIGQHLNHGPSLLQLSTPRIQGESIATTITTERSITNATFYYTRDGLTKDPAKRVWLSIPANVDGNTVTAKAPPKSATAWFFTAKDNVLVSSPLVISSQREAAAEKSERE